MAALPANPKFVLVEFESDNSYMVIPTSYLVKFSTFEKGGQVSVRLPKQFKSFKAKILNSGDDKSVLDQLIDSLIEEETSFSCRGYNR